MVPLLQGLGWKSNRKEDQNFRTDNGTKYESNEFNDYCREVGIKRETTTAYTPEQNGVVERKNQIIIEATHAMLHDQGLLKFLWGEASNTTMYIQNRCPHQALDFRTLEEVFTDKKLDVSHFRIFGLSRIFSCAEREEKQTGCIWEERNICGLQWNFKGI